MQKACNVLLIYPRFEADTFWNFRRTVRSFRRQISGIAARPDHRRGAAAAVLDHSAGQPQHRGAERRRPRLGRPGHDRRHAAAAARHARDHRALPRARQAGRRSADPGVTSVPHIYQQAELSGARRGRRRSSTSSSPPGRRARAKGVFEAREISGRRHQDADPALRSPEVRRLPLHRRAVLARLSVHLRVLRHHRTLRPRAAHQDQRRRCWPNSTRSTSSAIAATSTSSTTTSSATRRP